MSIQHGTRRGFQQHKAVRGIPCAACEDANRTYMREYMRARYTPERRRAQYEAAKARGYYARPGSAEWRAARCDECWLGIPHQVHEWEAAS